MQTQVMVEQFKGTIYEQGWGMLSKRVMQDKNLTVGAKALYAYLCSYAWGKSECYPTVGSIMEDLGIADKTFTRYRNELQQSGYVTVEFRNVRGQNRNVYLLNSTPVKMSPPSKKTPSKNDPVQNDPPNNKRNTSQDKKDSSQEEKATAEKKIRDYINTLEISEELRAKFHEYINYRKEIKRMFKTIKPIKALVDDVKTNVYTSEKNLIECMNIAMKNEYQGVFPTLASKGAGKAHENKMKGFADL